MTVFTPEWLSSCREFIMVSGCFLVAVYMILSWDDFFLGRYHPCPKHLGEMSSWDETWQKVPCKRFSWDKSSMRFRCFWRQGLDEFNSGRETFIPGSRDENTHVKQKFSHPGMQFILGQNSSRPSCKWALSYSKHFPCFYKAVAIPVEDWENEKSCGNTNHRWVFSQLFQVLTNSCRC